MLLASRCCYRQSSFHLFQCDIIHVHVYRFGHQVAVSLFCKIGTETSVYFWWDFIPGSTAPAHAACQCFSMHCDPDVKERSSLSDLQLTVQKPPASWFSHTDLISKLSCDFVIKLSSCQYFRHCQLHLEATSLDPRLAEAHAG